MRLVAQQDEQIKLLSILCAPRATPSNG